MARAKLPGLTLKRRIWQIDKVVNGQRICESTGQKDYAKAEAYAIKRINAAQENRHITSYTFDDAAGYYAETETKKSMERDLRCLDNWVPLIGDMYLEQIHMESLRPYINERLDSVRSSTVIRELAVVRRILILASRVWRNEFNQPWLNTIPLLSLKQLQQMKDKRKQYPLSWAEQNILFSNLPDYLQEMCLFKVNTGTRQEDVCDLQWQYEVPVPELNTSVFIIPETKNIEDRIIVLNDIAKSIIESQRDKHDKYVFTHKNNRIHRINNKAWSRAWSASGLPCGDVYYKGVHNLKHTFGMRLRKAGVSNETRKVLLGHKNGDITSHYSAAQLQELISAANKVCSSRRSPDITLLRLSEKVVSV